MIGTICNTCFSQSFNPSFTHTHPLPHGSLPRCATLQHVGSKADFLMMNFCLRLLSDHVSDCLVGTPEHLVVILKPVEPF